MILLIAQENLNRLFIVFIPQPIIIIIFFILAIKLLHRKRERSLLNLSLWYICVGIGLAFNAVYIIISELFPTEELLIHIIYFLTLYLLFTSHIFLLMFIISIIKSEFSLQRNILYTAFYFILCAGIIFFSGGITLDPLNNWRPLFSWVFFLIIISCFTLIIMIPAIYYTSKLYTLFQAKNLKKRFRYFMIGVYGMFMIAYGAALFNTWTNELFRTIWAVITSAIIVLSAILLYSGVGAKL